MPPSQPTDDRLLVWGKEGIDPRAIEQASKAARLPFVEGHVALMPDAHVGFGSTVGSVIPTKGAIIPSAVGVDIGCGMIAVETALTASDLPDDLGPLLSLIEKAVPAGVGQGHDSVTKGDYFLRQRPNRSIMEQGIAHKAVTQFGTLGSGNHFVEVCLDPDDTVWVVLHSGSRGVGNILARGHIEAAKGLMERRFISLEDPDLAYLVEDEPEFKAYMEDLLWAQDYALGNREAMMDAVLASIASAIDIPVVRERQRINCHHNYTAREHHRGKNIWVTRKGAIRARAGDLGVIPGSMGTDTYIVRGLGNAASFESSSHGAGRKMSRTQARNSLDPSELTEAMAGKTWLRGKAKALIDEHPEAYKDIAQVMAAQADLVVPVTRLEQVLNYKGT